MGGGGGGCHIGCGGGGCRCGGGVHVGGCHMGCGGCRGFHVGCRGFHVACRSCRCGHFFHRCRCGFFRGCGCGGCGTCWIWTPRWGWVYTCWAESTPATEDTQTAELAAKGNGSTARTK
jgi:hypothetical protein